MRLTRIAVFEALLAAAMVLVFLFASWGQDSRPDGKEGSPSVASSGSGPPASPLSCSEFAAQEWATATGGQPAWFSRC